MSDREEYFEWGYRLADGEEHWEVDHGTDGSWIGYVPALGIRAIDIYDDTTADTIRAALADAGVAGVVLRRKVSITRDPTEEL